MPDIFFGRGHIVALSRTRGSDEIKGRGTFLQALKGDIYHAFELVGRHHVRPIYSPILPKKRTGSHYTQEEQSELSQTFIFVFYQNIHPYYISDWRFDEIVPENLVWPTSYRNSHILHAQHTNTSPNRRPTLRRTRLAYQLHPFPISMTSSYTTYSFGFPHLHRFHRLHLGNAVSVSWLFLLKYWKRHGVGPILCFATLFC